MNTSIIELVVNGKRCTFKKAKEPFGENNFEKVSVSKDIKSDPMGSKIIKKAKEVILVRNKNRESCTLPREPKWDCFMAFTFADVGGTWRRGEHGVVVRAFGLYWGGIRFKSLSTHNYWSLSKSFIPSFVVWSMTKNNAFAEKRKTKRTTVR